MLETNRNFKKDDIQFGTETKQLEISLQIVLWNHDLENFNYILNYDAYVWCALLWCGMASEATAATVVTHFPYELC